jgi:hypothetical protein
VWAASDGVPLGVRLVVLGRLRAWVAVEAVARGHLLAWRALDAGSALAVERQARYLVAVQVLRDGARVAGVAADLILASEAGRTCNKSERSRREKFTDVTVP